MKKLIILSLALIFGNYALATEEFVIQSEDNAGSFQTFILTRNINVLGTLAMATLDWQTCQLSQIVLPMINSSQVGKVLFDEAKKQAELHQCRRLSWRVHENFHLFEKERELHKQLGADYFTKDNYAVCDLEK